MSRKLPAITLAFWLVKILATTLGEVGGDAASMSLGLGYLPATMLFALAFAGALAAQLAVSEFRPGRYWLAIVASTMLGTTLADFATRSLGIGYAGGSLLLCGLLAAALGAWRIATGSVAIDRIDDRRSEGFYWLTIMASQTLGTALADWVVDATPLGFGGGTLLFGALLAVVAALSRVPRVSRTALFWIAFVLTRPFGAALGDFLDKPLAEGGLALSRYAATLVLAAIIIVCVRAYPSPSVDARA